MADKKFSVLIDLEKVKDTDAGAFVENQTQRFKTTFIAPRTSCDAFTVNDKHTLNFIHEATEQIKKFLKVVDSNETTKQIKTYLESAEADD